VRTWVLIRSLVFICGVLTLALNESASGSTELEPGSRRRSCERPCAIIDVPNGMRLGVMGVGVIFRWAVAVDVV
jgi:hypothetical protein